MFYTTHSWWFWGLLIGFVTLVIMTMSILFDVFSEDADADVDYSQCGINNDYEDADGDDNEWFEQKVTLW